MWDLILRPLGYSGFCVLKIIADYDQFMYLKLCKMRNRKLMIHPQLPRELLKQKELKTTAFFLAWVSYSEIRIVPSIN